MRRRSASRSRARSRRHAWVAVVRRIVRSSAAALSADRPVGAPPGMRSRSSPCSRLRRRARSWARSSRRSESNRKIVVWSSGATTRRSVRCRATWATLSASVVSVLRPPPVVSSRARTDSVAGTSTTCSPAAASCWAIPRPRPYAPSTATHLVSWAEVLKNPAHASVEPHHGGCRPAEHAVSEPTRGRQGACEPAPTGTLDAKAADPRV
jgi:hypothetical protein